jgi:3-hydroxyisobutyrate dehydrogenase
MKVAFVGLGTMGGAMAANIVRAGHDVVVHNRSREKEEPLARLGAKRAADPAQAAAGAEVVVVCVSETKDVEAVVLGENGVIHGAEPDSTLIDTSTISPAATPVIAEQLAEKRIAMLDAPVSGGSEGARHGTLSIMVGGDPAVFARCRPVLEAMGKTIVHIGPIGTGQLTKAINQVVVGGTYWAVAEGVVMGLKAGLNMEKVVEALGAGAAGSWVLSNRSANMIRNDYPLGFRLRLHRKDLIIALEEARRLGLTLPLSALVEQIENGLIGRGHGDEDISSMVRSLRELSGMRE